MQTWQQIPPPGGNIACCCGDTLTLMLIAPPAAPPGQAWLRTNLGSAHIHRAEIIAHVEQHTPLLAGDWHDFPMEPAEPDPHSGEPTYRITITIHEPGVFEAKTFFLPEGQTQPCWPEGPNLRIKAQPATTVAANTIYTAFVRQFGPNRHSHADPPLPPEALAALDAEEWTLIPKSGTFRDLARELDHIIGTLGFRIIQLLPIHPVPTTFARMGRFGSPFAAIDFFNVDRALAEFDRRSTPLEQFGELVDAIHQRQARIFLDLPINHTGWASHLQVHHPEWFARNDDHSFASPGAWGVVWEDLSELDYQHPGLWHYMANVFLFWCARGVDGFRCDAGYMIPLPVWEYIVAKVRETYPDTVFLLEGLGGRISTTEALLDQAGLDWAYSEIFQVYDGTGLTHQLRHDHASARTRGALVHFAETHDNNRLAATSPAYARMRTALAALTADAGTFGITNGVEWFATAKVDVHGAPSLNWDAPDNQIAWIRTLNQLLASHPAFHQGAALEVLPSENAILPLLRTATSGESVLVLVNLDTEHPQQATWPRNRWSPPTCIDLLNGETMTPGNNADRHTCLVPAGGTLCLAAETRVPEFGPDRITQQRAQTLALALHAHLLGPGPAPASPPATLAAELLADPAACCARISGTPEQAVLTHWQAPADLYRTVMLPQRHILLVTAPHPFRINLTCGTRTRIQAESLPQTGGTLHFALLLPGQHFPDPAESELTLTLYTPDGPRHAKARVQRLSGTRPPDVPLCYPRESLRGSRACAILTNGRGAISQVRLEWGRIESQYDALLAANLHPSVPVDRHVLLTRCRIWLVHKGYSHAIGIDCTREVHVVPGQCVIWHFDVPAGMGRTVPLQLTLSWQQDLNRMQLHITRPQASRAGAQMADADPVQLILRPDIEDRNCHTATKAYTGPEHQWPAAIRPGPEEFSFTPGPHATMAVQLPGASFTSEPEWYYALPHPFEADRGLEPGGDLFSPGYFALPLQGGDQHGLTATVTAEEDGDARTPDITAPPAQPPRSLPATEILQTAIRDFVVRRDDARTVIAGYPWFLDWGRDTLICLRGMIAAGMLEASRDILKQFARFEKQGTIPNMIRGTDDRDRDTSDAPLWFFTACRDLMTATNDHALLDMDCGGRPLIAILQSLASHYMQGTPNGIKMDPGTGLIYSPSHFTWMDTNYPAGTPRQGYPIEIQALWYAALQFLAEIDNTNDAWGTRARQVQEAILTLYRLPEPRGGLADCLHATPGMPARQATPDNAVRPNQLLAVTLGAVQEKAVVDGILRATASLLIPGAIRSLGDGPVSPPLPIHGPSGLLNNPDHPYWGTYAGDEDTRRKPAYHNGTAWTWPFPSYCEALALYDPIALTPVARELLDSVIPLLQTGCIGHLPEILDGSEPHIQRGCWAQAWGATEAFRVMHLLQERKT